MELKKIIITALSTVIILFLLISCFGKRNDETENQRYNNKLQQDTNIIKKENENISSNSDIQQTHKKENKNTSQILNIGDNWTVPDQWNLTINSVTLSEVRNEFSEKQPSEVYIIDYTYENLGYEDDTQDLFLSPETYIDSQNQLGYDYPISITEYPKPTPVGASCHAQQAIGVDNQSDVIRVMFEKYDNNNKRQKVTFTCPITK